MSQIDQLAFAPWIPWWSPCLLLITGLHPRPVVLISAFACEPALWCVVNDSTCIGAEWWAYVQSFRFCCQRGTGDRYESKNNSFFQLIVKRQKRGISKKWPMSACSHSVSMLAKLVFVFLFVLYWYSFGVFPLLVCKVPGKLQSYLATGWGVKSHWQIFIFKRAAL